MSGIPRPTQREPTPDEVVERLVFGDDRGVSEDLRQHPRFRLALRVHLAMPGGTVQVQTVGVSRRGMSLRLSPPPALDEECAVTLELPNGTSVDGRARCRTHLPGCVCGMSLSFTGASLFAWDAFLDEEESTGSLWRMIGRIARAPDDALAPRGMQERVDASDLRFHTVGENGEAYRIAFEKHPSDAGLDSDLVRTLPGFREQALRLVQRVLRQPMSLRLDESGKLLRVRVAELQRGGFAYVQGEDGTPTGLVSLCVGELVLVSHDGVPVFPHYSDADLERIACDTFRSDLQRPVFGLGSRAPVPSKPAPVTLPPLPAPEALPARFQVGLDALRFAQAADDGVQIRRYGEREVFFHPSVWARVTEPEGELIGPTLHDGVRFCMLALVGAGAPRVVRLDENSAVALLKRPAR